MFVPFYIIARSRSNNGINKKDHRQNNIGDGLAF